MIFQRDIRTGQSAAAYIVVKNAQTSTLPVGGPACWDNIFVGAAGYSARITQQSGYQVTQHTINWELVWGIGADIRGSGMILLAGIVAPRDLQPGSFGLVQCYGYCPTVRWAKPTETAWWSNYGYFALGQLPVRDLGPCNAFYLTFANFDTNYRAWPGEVAGHKVRFAATFSATWNRTVEESLDWADYAEAWNPTVTTVTIAYAPGFVNCM